MNLIVIPRRDEEWNQDREKAMNRPIFQSGMPQIISSLGASVTVHAFDLARWQ
jgi:hypothetical protein